MLTTLRRFMPFRQRSRQPLTWDEAVALCAVGYDSVASIRYAQSINAKVMALGTQLDTAHMCLLAAIQLCKPRTVLDFGGALGVHYHVLKRFLPRTKWTVVELPETVRAARQFECEDLRFSTEIEPADLVIASGTLQLLQDPYAMLARLVALRPKHLIVGRAPIVEKEKLTIHEVPAEFFRASLPYWLLGEERYEAETSKLGLHELLRWDYPYEQYKGFLYSSH